MSKTKWYAKPIYALLALALVLSLGIMAVPMAGTAEANGPETIEVSQPIQVTSNDHYERGESIVYDGTNYWMFYGRSASCTGTYQNEGGNPVDAHDYAVYFKKATTIAGLASAAPTAVADPLNSYLGETGAAYFDGKVWAFATVDPTPSTAGDQCALYGWYSSDGTTWTQTEDLRNNRSLSDGQAHHDEIVFDGKLWSVTGQNKFYTSHASSDPQLASSWSAKLLVDDSIYGGLVHFFVDGSDLYLAINSGHNNYIYKYNPTTLAWDAVDSLLGETSGWDPTLFKVDSTYVFAQSPWVNEGGGRQYTIAWSGNTLSDTFFDRTGDPVSVTAGRYGTNTWTDMWPIGFTDASGDSYLFFTSERNPNDVTSEIAGNIWYLKVDWPVTNDHYTYIQEAIDAATGTTINVAAGTYDEQVVIDKSLTLQGAGDTTIIQPSQVTVDSFQLFTRRPVGTGVTAAFVVVNGVQGNGVTIKNIKVDASLVENSTASSDKLVTMLYRAGAGIVDAVTFYGNDDWPDDAMYLTPIDKTVMVEVKNCNFSNFWKNGITANYSGLTANIHDNIIIGRGEVPEAVQNGIQYGWGATGTASGNTISGMADTTGTWTATGILFYEAGGTATGNTITDCETGIQFEECGADSYSATVQNNTIDASGLSESLAYTVGICLETFDTSSLTATIDGNDLSVGGSGDGISIGADAGGDVPAVDATISNNEISDWNDGIWLGGSTGTVTITGNTITNNVGAASGIHIDAGVDVSNISAHCNNIEGNEGYGVYNGGTGILDATNNWWGATSGPYDPDGTVEAPPCTDDPTTEKNADGTGDEVSDNVDYCPWYDSVLEPSQSGETATGTGVATFTSSDGNVRNFTAVDEATLPPEGKPDLNFPHGFFSFDICCLEPGETATVTIELPDNVPVGTQYWKYHASEGGWIEIPMGSDDGDDVITITLVDGGLGDDDGLANGLIVDSGGPGQPPPPPPVGVGGEAYPVSKLGILAPWLALVAAIMAGAAIFMRRRRAQR